MDTQIDTCDHCNIASGPLVDPDHAQLALGIVLASMQNRGRLRIIDADGNPIDAYIDMPHGAPEEIRSTVKTMPVMDVLLWAILSATQLLGMYGHRDEFEELRHHAKNLYDMDSKQ